MDDLGKTSLVGRTLAHYRINHALGAGGMGEVYRATDTKLGRDVALKVLPSEMANDPDRLARFQREARAVAALNHPNVVTIYSVEESDSVHFITMELIEGQPLDRLISGNGLPVDRIIEIAGAIAEALAAAHEKAIVHRDLKPANVMVTSEGRVKVLDFGLAKDVGAETAKDTNATLTSAGRTEAGIVMGTPAYMSPEQVSGRPLDHRSDIFSLGVLLHEMATGRRPFEGTSSAELISSILRDHPPSVSDARPELPPDLARVIRRCLEKDPRYRVQTARDVSNEFRELARTTTRSTMLSTSPARPTIAAGSGPARADEGFWVAVLPFKYVGGNADLVALAGALTDDVVTGMSKFSYLRVIARSSTAQYAQRTVDIRTAAKELGARYVMEGSLRQAGSKLRLTVQLVEATTGSHLWAETYERGFNPDAVFELQDELVPRIVSTVADRHGVLPHSMSEAVRAKDPEQLTPYEAVLLSFSYAERITSDEQIAAKACLERAVAQAPGYADAWAMLAMTFCDEFGLGFKAEFSLLERGLEAARRAVKAGPSNHLGYQNLAYAHLLRREFGPCRSAVERSLALNSMDGCNVWFMGLVLAYMGDWERGCALVERAMQLNPHFPEKYHFPLVANAYRRGDYRGALNEALRMNLPDVFYSPLNVAAAAGQLGEREAAEKALRDVLRLKPDIAKVVREDLGKWFQPELVEHYIEGLVKAGLEIPASGEALAVASSAISARRTTSGEARADEGFWVAVLPFQYSGGNPDLASLANGLTDEVITGLSRFSYLRVIARGSTAKYSGEPGDVRSLGKELGARYVLSGNLRQVGTRFRVAAQLVDAGTGAQLWSESYERPFSAETVFEIQDDIAARIAATVGDAHGILAHNMSEWLREKAPDQLTVYEAVLRSFGYGYRQTPQEHAEVRDALERAVEKAPRNADAWAMLTRVYVDELTHGTNQRPDPLGRMLQAARQAVDAAPSSAMAFGALAYAMFFRKEFQAFRTAAEQSIALNPLNSPTLAGLGAMLAYSGEWERGCALAERAMQLNPRHPGWYWIPLYVNAYRKGEYRNAVNCAIKINLPGFYVMHEALAAAYGQLGEHEKAAESLREVIRLKPDYAIIGRERLEKWFDTEMVDHLMDGLGKAGLEIAARSVPNYSAPTTGAVRTASGATSADEGFWLAVLPFKYTGSNADLKALAEGLSEEVITGLSRFSYLRVIARGSTAKYSSESGDVRAIGKELGARYVMEASLRQAGNKLRVAVQLVDTVSGSHLWAENYERSFTPESVFEIQDDLVPRMVSTVADAYGVLAYSMSDVVRNKPLERLTPYESVLRAIGYGYRLTPEEHAAARTCMERAVQQAPGFADGWAMLSLLYTEEYGFEFPGPADPLGLALHAARRATEAAPASALAQTALAKTLFFRKEFQAFRSAAEKAIALNPMDGAKLANLGSLLAYAGDWDHGCALLERAMQLNPRHPGWYWFPLAWNAYRKDDYPGAVNIALKINLPGFIPTYEVLAAAYGQLGERDAAGRALNDILKLAPNFGSIARRKSKWFQREMAEHVLDGLRKAGLEISEADSQLVSSGAQPVRTDSGAARAQEGFWVAVLPFKYTGSNADLKALAEGLSDEVITGLSRFSYLRVIARASTAKYSSESGDVRAIGKELGARYVMEGSLRQAGSKLRVAVQLADTVSGAHLWAETYERAFTAESIFEVQDDLVPRIVSTVADQYGVLPRSMSDVLRSKRADALSAHEAVLRAFSYFSHIAPEEHAVVRDILERAVGEVPDHADSWAMLSMIYRGEFAQGYNPRANPLDRALAAAQRAVELAPTHALGHYALATVYFFRKEKVPFRVEAERALSLNPLDASVKAYLGLLIAATGEWDRGCRMVESALQLNPNCPGYFYFARCWNAYWEGRYEEALEGVALINMPNYFHVPAIKAAAFGQLGRREEAQKVLREVLTLRPDFAGTVRQEYGKWFDPELIEPVLDGLRKAGLKIPEK